MKWKNKFGTSVTIQSLSILNKSEKIKISIVLLCQILLGFLDLLGVAVIGVLGALTVNGIQSKTPGNRILKILEIAQIQNLNFQSQVSVLGLFAACVLVMKTIFSVILTRRILFFMSSRSAITSSLLIDKILKQDITQLQQKSSQETLFAVTSGVSAITMGVIATTISMLADLFLLLILASGLFLVNAIIAISTFVFFGLIGFSLYRLMHKRAHQLGIESSYLNVSSIEKILEVLNSYREIFVRNRRGYYSSIISQSRHNIAQNSAEIAFLPNIGKYVIESGLVVGALLICGIQFHLQDATHAIATLTIFLAAGSRIAPAVLRVQQGLVSIKNSLGAARPTLELINSLENTPIDNIHIAQAIFNHEKFEATLKMEFVDYRYPNRTENAVHNVNLEIKNGEFIAIVGPSGAGKSTLVDLILGIIKPSKGSIQLSGMSPEQAIKQYEGAISYVPQDISIKNGTIKENIAFGYDPNLQPDSYIWDALQVANLESFVKKLNNKLDSQVGERGSKLSGGQRQRLGIARAMFTKPKFIVLDEATSALDSQTELEITSAISKLKGKVTVLVVAHRLSTIKNADIIFYMEHGKIKDYGKFEEIRKRIPNFDTQAKLSGI